MTGLRNSAATSRMIPIASASNRLRWLDCIPVVAGRAAVMATGHSSQADEMFLLSKKNRRNVHLLGWRDRCWSSQALVRLVEDDSKPASDTKFGGHINPNCVPSTTFLDQQRRAAVASRSNAVVPHQQPATGIG